MHPAHLGMTRYVRLLLALVLAAPAAAQGTPTLIRVRIETRLGDIDAELDSTHAPVTVANFVRYVDAHLFDDGIFHRVVTMANQPTDSIRIEVIQGGVGAERRAQSFPAIPLERTSVTGLHHGDGALAMARNTPNSATGSFFITIGEQPALDFGGKRNPDGQGFAAFGRVTRGMEIVRRIQSLPANGQALVEPVAILRIVRR